MESTIANIASIKTQVLLRTLIPLLISTIILGYYMAMFRIQDSENALRERGETLVRHISRESEFGLFSADPQKLIDLANLSTRERDVYEATIMNREREPVARSYSSDPALLSSISDSADDLLIHFASAVYGSAFGGSENDEHYDWVGSAAAQDNVIGWVELKLSRASTLSRQKDIVANIILVTLGSALFSVLLALWMGQGIVRPIVQLCNAVVDMRKSLLGTRVRRCAGGELGALEHGFNDMAEGMEKSHLQLYNEITSTTSKLSLLLESIPVAVFLAGVDEKYEISFITPSVKQLTGFDAEHFLANGSLWLDKIHPDDRNKMAENLGLLKKTGAFEAEYRWEMADGRYKWFYSHIRLSEAPEGDASQLIGMWQDITEFKTLSQQLVCTITALQQRNRELDVSRREALDASRDKANFLASMSHEIRTPLSSIVGYTSKLESYFRKSEVKDDRYECVRIIGHASAQLRRIIDDILSLSKLESGTAQLDQVPFDFRSNLEDAVCMMSAEIGDRKLELSLLVESNIPAKLAGDPNRINQVMINLLSNAIKFTETGSVDVRAALRSETDDEAEIEIKVSDTGVGMSQDVMQNIFKPFHQGDALISRRYGGTGLGLSIASMMASLLGGEIGVTSDVGKGSTFCFNLRCRKQRLEDGLIVTKELWRKKVLLYDDHLPSLRAVRSQLLHWTGNIYQARSRCQIKPMIDSSALSGAPYDLVIIGAGVFGDVHEGIGISQLLKMIREDNDVPVLLMMNRQRSPRMAELCQGMDNVVLMKKPVRRDTLYHHVCNLMNVKEDVRSDSGNTAPEGATPYDGMRILLVEDNEFNGRLIAAQLETRGVIVTRVTDGNQALQRAMEDDFDMVVLDIHLPGMDGAETARRIRTLRQGYKTIPIIAFTADIFFNTPERLAGSSIDACLLKPLDEAKLWGVIDSLRVDRDNANLGAGIPATHRVGARMNESVNVWDPPHPVTASHRDHASVLPGLIASLESINSRIACVIAGQNRENLPAIIHELKGMVCYFGIAGLSRVVFEIERLIRIEPNAEKLSVLLQKTREEITDLSAACHKSIHETNAAE